MQRGKTRESESCMIGFGLTSAQIKQWREFFSQSFSVVDAKPINKLTSVFHASVLLLMDLPSGSADNFDNVMTKGVIYRHDA